jgi:DNA-binding NarL/FixJ family response regulator
MKVLILEDIQANVDVIKQNHPYAEVKHASRYLQFLHEIENNKWDIIYVDDDFSESTSPDFWFDSCGFKREFNGVHAARALATLAEIGKCPTKKVVISASSDAAKKMFEILNDSKVEVIRKET